MGHDPIAVQRSVTENNFQRRVLWVIVCHLIREGSNYNELIFNVVEKRLANL